ncbi:hypothetical protein [Jannaschia ovalis]|uniref:Uncharacterized protein n=1 Tax=Jannaschia ovalis TaxID=3038773 RepID=A0ABY8L870_9RHOB|nr:hypothetical protein [Jannaschia sp. GRR-S6-38]WGH77464.1 hypothetical protein P8627_10435 [Jannaschia sp. GRR-S6-38]
MSLRAAALAVALTGCTAAAPNLSPTPPPRGLALVPAPGGLLVAGSGGREIGFGRAQAGALASVAKVQGATPVPTGCGRGRQAFRTAEGLVLVFEAGRFVGWAGVAGAAGRGCA